MKLTKDKIAKILSSLGIYLIAAGISFAFFDNVFPSQARGKINTPVPSISPVEKKKDKVDPSLPKNEICPLNGAKYTQLEKEDWEKRRPLAIMVENSEDARPQSGR